MAEWTCGTAWRQWVFVGDASGFVSCFEKQTVARTELQEPETHLDALEAVNGVQRKPNVGSTPADPFKPRQHTKLSFMAYDQLQICVDRGEWKLQLFAEPISCIHAVDDSRVINQQAEQKKQSNRLRVLLIVGSAKGTLVFLRNRTEVQRLQMESTVLMVRKHGQEFVVGDLLGNMYGISLCEGGQVLWKKKPQSVTPLDPRSSLSLLYPPSSRMMLQALETIQITDVEQTLSTYLLASTSQNQLFLTHRGQVFDTLLTKAPVVSICSLAVALDTPPIALVACQDGIISKLVASTTIDTHSNERETASLCLSLDVFAQVDFAIKAICAPSLPTTSWSGHKWICLGKRGEVAVFHGNQQVSVIDTWSQLEKELKDKSEPIGVATVLASDGNSSDQNDAVAVLFHDGIALVNV